MKKPERPKAIAAIILAAVAGGGFVGVETILDMGDQRWVTVKSSNSKIEWYLQDIIDELRLTNTLLKGNLNIFVPGMTERYDLLEYESPGSCHYYDRLEREYHSNSGCPVTGMTKDSFNAMITDNPEP